MGKKNWLLAISLALVLAIVGLAGCVSEEPPVSHGGPVTDYVSLIDNLRQAGATVEPAGEVTQPFFAVTGNIITVNGGDVQVFEYADAAAAEAEAALVSPDGSSVGTTMVAWVVSPHFYRAEKLIVLYVGDSEAVTDVLESVLGQQFAGGAMSIDFKGLEDITWILESYGEPESLQTVLEGTEITALFDSAEGQVTGSAGANHYFGAYQISKNKLSIQEIAHTEMYRLEPEGIMEQEDYYLKTLQAAESYEIEDGKLQITSGNQVLIFRASEESPVIPVTPTLYSSISIPIEEFPNHPHIDVVMHAVVGEELTVTLGSNPTTGFQWSEYAEISDESVIKQVSHKFVGPGIDKPPGTPGEEVWTFEALKKGTVITFLEYSRPWIEEDVGHWTVTITTTIK